MWSVTIAATVCLRVLMVAALLSSYYSVLSCLQFFTLRVMNITLWNWRWFILNSNLVCLIRFYLYFFFWNDGKNMQYVGEERWWWDWWIRIVRFLLLRYWKRAIVHGHCSLLFYMIYASYFLDGWWRRELLNTTEGVPVESITNSVTRPIACPFSPRLTRCCW